MATKGEKETKAKAKEAKKVELNKKGNKRGAHSKGKQTGTYVGEDGKTYRIVNGKKTHLRATTPKEARVNGKKGGIASGEARAEKRTLREDLEILMSRKVTDPKLKKTLAKIAGIDEKAEITNQEAVNIALYGALLKGNVKAFEHIQATLGQAPSKGSSDEQTQRKVEIIDDLPDDKS